jgi:hypothetical protein
MTEDAKYFYQAKPGETVTLKARITGDAFVEVGTPMQPMPESDTTWFLAIPKKGFSPAYVFMARVDFEEPPPGSQVAFKISGSNGGTFSVDPIDPSTNNKTPGFAIRVK